MEKQKKWIVILFAVFLIVGIGLDRTESSSEAEDGIARDPAGGDIQSYDLRVSAGDVLKDYPYSLEVEPIQPDEKEIAAYFAEAKKEIDQTMYIEGESADHVTEKICIRDSYADEKISAEWIFDNYDVMDTDGTVIAEDLPKSGTLVSAEVYLSGFEHREIYRFTFTVYPPVRTESDQILLGIKQDIKNQMEKTGQEKIKLPQEQDGIRLKWTLQKEHYFLKILFFEIILGIGLLFLRRERESKERKKYENGMLLAYPELVSKITVLRGAGMSLKESMNRIAASYLVKRENGSCEKNDTFEEIVRVNREINDGENEREALKKFAERTGVRCYKRLIGMILEQEEKGGTGLNEKLNREAEEAFAVRKANAKKLGEEASTKMLFPMILMLGIVMAIIIVPAIIGFNA